MATTLAHTLPAKPLAPSHPRPSTPGLHQLHSQQPLARPPIALAPSHAALAAAHSPFGRATTPLSSSSASASAATPPAARVVAPAGLVPFSSTSRCSHLAQALVGTDEELNRFTVAVRWSFKLERAASEHHHLNSEGKKRKVSSHGWVHGI